MSKQNAARTGINFRTSYIHHRTGKRVYARPGHPFPIPIGPKRRERHKPLPPMQLVLPGMETFVEAPRPPRASAKVRTAQTARGRRR
ncbi:hypothetical protein [Polyangium spumosum]|uniref:Uncharacterized protein n=1 Tax=Polyangium spumosum TaxID=889282 RepID=A0A6N7PMS8_9BACT|nr:hypothetical protein [Polyangium spumosum]MRG91590.1 hypothetical protein [Polyangium spumosum]